MFSYFQPVGIENLLALPYVIKSITLEFQVIRAITLPDYETFLFGSEQVVPIKFLKLFCIQLMVLDP